MPSIIEGYNYDIFISYRQKDNKGDRWVSRFVEALKTELESTFKDDISVYFDENPHDRLQETHDVNKSLESKLKCLIFIPILSQTYCDPNSYAWQHEFLSFLNMVKNDHFGKDVRLRSGNVASRILPIRIHDLETEDVKLYESETGSVLRAVEFVFKTASSVNRPLQPEDNKNDNLNKTIYRDQVNKVANAIKEIFFGMKTELVTKVEGKGQSPGSLKVVTVEKIKEMDEKPAKINKRRLLLLLVAVILLTIAGIFVFNIIFKNANLEKLGAYGKRISVAVMPFQNMTNDTTWNVWQDGIQDMLITSLSDIPEDLSIRQFESVNSLIQNKGIVNYASLTPTIAGNISQQLEANFYIYGNIKKAGSELRVYAQLIDSKTKDVIKSFLKDGRAKEDNMFLIIDSLSRNIKDYLTITRLIKEISPEFQRFTTTNNPDAYRYFVQGENSRRISDHQSAVRSYLQALQIDSNFYLAGLRLSSSYYNLGWFDLSKKWNLFVYNKRDKLPMPLKIQSEQQHALCFETPHEEIKCLRQLLEVDNQSPATYYGLGYAYFRLQQYDKAIPMFEKALMIYHKWNTKPYRAANYFFLGIAYHKTGQYKKERQLYEKAERDFPDNSRICSNRSILSLTQGDTIAANRDIKKLLLIFKEYSVSEADITLDLASIYSDAGLLNKAEEYLRKSLSLDPDNPYRLNNLAWFLIDKDRNINEGLNLIEKAKKLNISEYFYVDCMGYGLLKLGKYKEALEFLMKSDSLKPIYNHDLFLHLEAAKKAVAEMKKN